MNGRQRRWRGAIAASIVLVVAGLFDRNGVLLLAAGIPLAYVAVGSLSRVRPPEGLTATRRLDSTPVPPGRPVTVTLTVTNESDRTVPDLRVADGVPGELAVLDGTPRAGGTLAPGEELTIQYLLSAKRGDHEFRQPHLRVRGLGVSARETGLLPTDGDESLVCRLDADAPPIDEYGSGRAGQLATDTAGPGVTFHSIREYHPSDSADRIDWRHYAKRNELATTNYERHVAATVVLVVDARPCNRVVPAPGRPTAVEIGVYAATHAMTDLLRRSHDVGIAVLGVDGAGPAGISWLPPAGGSQQRARILELLRQTADATDTPAGDTEQVRKLLELRPNSAQFLFTSPLLDDVSTEAVETWRAAGVPVTVFSPDILSENTVSGQYAQLRRRTRLARCQSTGARTVDWRRGTPLAVVLSEAFVTDARLPSARHTGRIGGGGGR